MKGDFSSWWDSEMLANISGVLHQQGRVLLDRDWNAQVRITSDWQDHMGRSLLGHDAVDVSEEQGDSFLVKQAVKDSTVPGGVLLSVAGGNAWLNGRALTINSYGNAAMELPATEYQNPNNYTHECQAVILEMWEEPINGYQMPETLLEPALGGPDTTERMQRCLAFRLVPAAMTETRDAIYNRVKDDLSPGSKKGRCFAGLQATPVDNSACPLNQAGGYTGFENNLYRVEIAALSQPSAGAMFKWSRYNGGLTGQGFFKRQQPRTIKILSNLPAIQATGLNSFYVEVVRLDNRLPRSEVVYGATMDLNGDTLSVSQEYLTTPPDPDDQDIVFIRLWDGIRRVSDFQHHFDATPSAVLQDGITLEFDAESNGNYRAGDYWMFSVRVGQGPGKLMEWQTPRGIFYHRAPLALLNWGANQVIAYAQGQITDLRLFFKPLTKIQVAGGKTCCTFTVGDGKTAPLGDFPTLDLALSALYAQYPEGGQICLLPGIHKFSVTLSERNNIRIYGCAGKSIVQPLNNGTALTLNGCLGITVDHLYFQFQTAPGPVIAISQPTDWKSDVPEWSSVEISDNLFLTPGPAVDVRQGLSVKILKNKITLGRNGKVGLFVQSVYALIEKNLILGIAHGTVCDGGIQIGSSSERITIKGNVINGGTGHGICLGHMPNISGLTGKYFIDDTTGYPEFDNLFESYLYDINIEDNDISNMGQNGIGIPAFFNINKKAPYMFSLWKAVIARNRIVNCVQKPNTQLDLSWGLASWAGIALADAEEIVIQDNCIEDNELCGIFVLLAEKITLEGNILRNNGGSFLGMTAEAYADVHGGVMIHMAFQPSKLGNLALDEDPNYGLETAESAVVLNNNKIIQPLGLALSLVAMGPITAAHNQFSSQDVFYHRSDPDNNGKMTPFGVVQVINLGIPRDAYHPFWLYSFMQLRKMNTCMLQNCLESNRTGIISEPWNPGGEVFKLLPRGRILWSENVVAQDVKTPKASIDYLYTPQLLASFDDIAYANNTVVHAALNCYTYFNTMLFATSVRVVGNRFEEGYTQAYFSLLAVGSVTLLMANQSTHSVIALGSVQKDTVTNTQQDILINTGNTVVVEQCPDIMAAIVEQLKNLV